jgi:hypothetical protein
MWSFNASDCLIEVTSWSGLTVLNISYKQITSRFASYSNTFSLKEVIKSQIPRKLIYNSYIKPNQNTSIEWDVTPRIIIVICLKQYSSLI